VAARRTVAVVIHHWKRAPGRWPVRRALHTVKGAHLIPSKCRYLVWSLKL
jgi:hypothetical protein